MSARHKLNSAHALGALLVAGLVGGLRGSFAVYRLALLVASSWLMPWYVVWALPLAAVARDRRLSGSVLGLCAFQLVNRVPM